MMAIIIIIIVIIIIITIINKILNNNVEVMQTFFLICFYLALHISMIIQH